MKITDALLGEHGVFYALFDHIEKTAASLSLEEAKKLGAFLHSALASHARLEDEVLFSRLEPHLGVQAGPLAVMRVEHEEIEGTLEGLPELPKQDQAQSALLRIVTTARNHFAKEEQVLFSLAQQYLGEEELKHLGQLWASRRRVFLAP